MKRFGLDSFCLTETNQQRITLGKWSMAFWLMLPRSYWGKKSKWEGATRHNSEGNIMEVSSVGVCPSTSCWKEPLVDSQQQTLPFWYCVYDSTRGATTADTENQVAAIMHSLQGSGDCAWSHGCWPSDQWQWLRPSCGGNSVWALCWQWPNWHHKGTRSTSLTPLEMPR